MTEQTPPIDLQSHSLHSDGLLPPEGVVETAARAGVELLALSDHDTVDGVDEALAAAERLGLRLLPATEISAVDDGYEDLHILGYGIDHHDATLLERLAGARSDRELRSERMAERLDELGFAVDPGPLQRRSEEGKPIGRPHLAAAVLGHPGNAARLEQEELSDVSSFIPAYLIPGAPAYVGRTRPTVAEAIGWIHDAGGVAVWAHPFWDIESPEAVLRALERYREAGVDGIEAFYVTHDAEQTRLLADRCEDLDLIATGSSDFHGPSHRMFSRFRAYRLYGRRLSVEALRARAFVG